MPETKLSLRGARRRDIAELVGLINTAYGRTSKKPGWTSEGHLIAGPRVTEQEMREIIEDPRSSMLVASDGSAPVACVHLRSAGDEACKLGMLAVGPQAQGQGVGRWLMNEAEAYAREEMGRERMVLHVLTEREELFPWYESQGYETTGERVPLELEGDQRSLAGPLALEVLEKPLT